MLHQHKRRSDIQADRLVPFDWRDLCERFRHCDASIIHEQIDWFLAYFGDQVRNSMRRRQIVYQERDPRALRC